MISMQSTISAAERSVRSVFVGNIPYEATEEQLKDIFAEVGPVISFRLVYDRENGKPKGYGFCEYKDQDTAMSAMRNLNGYELNGRALRVDNAANEKNKEELRNLQATLGGPPVESPYGPECDPDKAPEAISKAVASLPPEQMFELMKQMKSCIQNNPNEARNMLLVNPQLAYALLQAQVVMRIVEPQVAMGMLLRPNNDVQPLRPHSNVGGNGPPPQNQQQLGNNSFIDPPSYGGGGGGGNTQMPMGPDPRSGFHGPPGGGPPPGGMGNRDFDMRGDPRGGFDSRPGDRDIRMGPGGGGGSGGGGGGHPGMGRDPRDQPRDPREQNRDPRDHRNMPHDGDMRQNFDPRARGGGGDPRTSRGPMDFEPRGMPGTPFDHRGPPGGFPERGGGGGGGGFDQRSPVYEQRDPRSHASPQGPRPPMGPQLNLPVGRQGPPNIPQAGLPLPPNIGSGPGLLGSQDQEKAALIMQVLQLSEQQIAMLPPEQRQSIMVLKEQIARSAQNQ